MRYRVPLGGITQRYAMSTMARLIASRLGNRPTTPLLSPADLAERVRTALGDTEQPSLVRPVAVSQKDGWVDTGVVLRRGDQLIVVASGMLWALRRAGMGIGPEAGLWIRVGAGAVVSMLGTSMLIEADADGPVRLLAAEPGLLTETGAVDDTMRRIPLSGSFAVAVLACTGDPAALLAQAAVVDPAVFGVVAGRTSHPGRTPAGWHYHPRLGAADIFQTAPAPRHDEIECVTRGDVGILCRPADVAITDRLHMSWQWLITALPSALPEHIEPTHDYLSVAVAFDDGRDLSWMWSAELAVGTAFRCPLPYWRDRETHLVVRTGSTGLGTWITERRNIADDIRTALAPPYPRRITATWLIANSAFQRGTGVARFRTLDLTTTAADVTEEQH